MLLRQRNTRQHGGIALLIFSLYWGMDYPLCRYSSMFEFDDVTPYRLSVGHPVTLCETQRRSYIYGLSFQIQNKILCI